MINKNRVRAGLSQAFPLPEEEIIGKWKSGIGFKRLGKMYGTSHQRIKRLIRRNGLFGVNKHPGPPGNMVGHPDCYIMSQYMSEWNQCGKTDQCNHWAEWRAEAIKSIMKGKHENYKISCRLRAVVYSALKRASGKRHVKAEILLGCSINHCRSYLESKFSSGMGWHNMGKWHIDHIIPCASFNLTDAKHQRICFHFTNLQPLWAQDNIKKGARVIENQYSLCI